MHKIRPVPSSLGGTISIRHHDPSLKVLESTVLGKPGGRSDSFFDDYVLP